MSSSQICSFDEIQCEEFYGDDSHIQEIPENETMRQKIAKLESPKARELLMGLLEELEQSIVVSDEWLPDSKKRGRPYTTTSGQVNGRTIAELEKMYSHSSENQFNHAAEKERRIELYRKQVEQTGGIQFEQPIPGADLLKKRKKNSILS
jgi:hypothetical protein